MKTDSKQIAGLTALGLLAAFISVTMVAARAGDSGKPFSPYVDSNGQISVPTDYRTKWTFMGTWSIAKEDVETSAAASGHGAAALHNVYTQPGVVEAYRQTGEFPDGAVLVKELLKTETERLTTGRASWGYDIEGWFVMIKDTVGRFKGNPLWGEGWGWALFGPEIPPKLTTTNFRTDCLGCHLPAQDSDFVFVDGYPVLAHDRIGG